MNALRQPDRGKDRPVMLLAGLLLCVPALFAVGRVAPSGLAAQIGPPTVTPTWTTSPTITPTATLSALVTDLKRELIFPLGGAEGEPCDANTAPIRRPAINYQRADSFHADDVICLFGFAKGEKLKLKLFNPSGRIAIEIPLVMQNDALPSRSFSVNIVSLPPLAYHAPAGPWSIRVEGGAVPATVNV